MKRRTLFSVLKATEGGIGQKGALELLRANGIECTPTTSPYVGHTGLYVFGGKATVKKAENLLF